MDSCDNVKKTMFISIINNVSSYGARKKKLRGMQKFHLPVTQKLQTYCFVKLSKFAYISAEILLSEVLSFIFIQNLFRPVFKNMSS